MMMRSKVGMYTVRMVPSSLLALFMWNSFKKINFFWIVLKPSKYDFHFNVAPWIQADVGLPWTNGRNVNCDKTTIGSVLWIYFWPDEVLGQILGPEIVKVLWHELHKLSRVALALEDLEMETLVRDAHFEEKWKQFWVDRENTRPRGERIHISAEHL